MLSEQRNSRKQGDVGLGAAIGYFTTRGYTVCIPLTDSQEYDLVVELEDGLKKIQVKTTYYKTPSGNYSANLKTCGGNRTGTGKIKYFSDSFADYVFILCESGDIYLIPSGILGRCTVTLGATYEEYKL